MLSINIKELWMLPWHLLYHSTFSDPFGFYFKIKDSELNWYLECRLRLVNLSRLMSLVTFSSDWPWRLYRWLRTTDTMTFSNPGGAVPPTICGYNTGQHMWVPASDSCNQINIDIDTGSTSSTTRRWQIKVTQYKCGHIWCDFRCKALSLFRMYLIFSCEEAAREGLTEVSGSQRIVHIEMHLDVLSM